MPQSTMVTSIRLLTAGLLLLILFVYNVKAGESCKKGSCILEKSCKSRFIAKCGTGMVCCETEHSKSSGIIKEYKKKEETRNKDILSVENIKDTSSKRICIKSTKKCLKKGGICQHYQTSCATMEYPNRCKGASCKCCAYECSKSKKCLKKGGECKTFCDKSETYDKKGKCKGLKKGDCKCCIPIGPVPQPAICSDLSSMIHPIKENSENEIEFTAGLPFSEEEIQAAMLEKPVLDIEFKLPCSARFPNKMHRAVVNTNWPNAKIPYEIQNSSNAKQRKFVILAMKEIKTKTCITFPERDNSHSNWLRITLDDEGCFSDELGVSPTPPNIIGLAWTGCFSQGTIVHELLHVAGLGHEQNRQDRDDFVTILWDNLQPGDSYIYQFCKVDSKDTGHPYDYASVMHYTATAFSKDGKLKTIDSKGNPIGQDEGMSQGDVDQINHVYKCPQK